MATGDHNTDCPCLHCTLNRGTIPQRTDSDTSTIPNHTIPPYTPYEPYSPTWYYYPNTPLLYYKCPHCNGMFSNFIKKEGIEHCPFCHARVPTDYKPKEENKDAEEDG